MLAKIAVFLVVAANFALFYGAAHLVRRRPEHTLVQTIVVMSAACLLAALLNGWLYRRWQHRR